MNLIVTKIFCQSLDPLLYWGCTVLNFIIFQKVGGGALASPAPLLARALVQSCPWSSHPPSPPSHLSLHSGNQWQKKLYFLNIQFIESVKIYLQLQTAKAMWNLLPGSSSSHGNLRVCTYLEHLPMSLTRCSFKPSNSSSLRKAKSLTLLASCIHFTFVNRSWRNFRSFIPSNSRLSRALKSFRGEEICSNSPSSMSSKHKNFRSSRIFGVTFSAIWRRRFL